MNKENKIEQIITLANEKMPTEFFSPQETYLKGVMFGVEQAAREYSSLSAVLGSAEDDFTSGANWQASKHIYTEQKQDCPKCNAGWFNGSKCQDCGYVKDIHERITKSVYDAQVKAQLLLTGFEQDCFVECIQAALLTPPTYTQEQMIAFGEVVKQECANNVLFALGHNILPVNSILNIDISKLLKK